MNDVTKKLNLETELSAKDYEIGLEQVCPCPFGRPHYCLQVSHT